MTPPGACVGNVTEAFMKREQIENVAINDRWKSVNSVRQYILNGQAALATAPIPDKDMRKIREYATKFVISIERKLDRLRQRKVIAGIDRQ